MTPVDRAEDRLHEHVKLCALCRRQRGSEPLTPVVLSSYRCDAYAALHMDMRALLAER